MDCQNQSASNHLQATAIGMLTEHTDKQGVPEACEMPDQLMDLGLNSQNQFVVLSPLVLFRISDLGCLSQLGKCIPSPPPAHCSQRSINYFPLFQFWHDSGEQRQAQTRKRTVPLGGISLDDLQFHGMAQNRVSISASTASVNPSSLTRSRSCSYCSGQISTHWWILCLSTAARRCIFLAVPVLCLVFDDLGVSLLRSVHARRLSWRRAGRGCLCGFC